MWALRPCGDRGAGALEGVTSVSVDLVPDGVSTVTVEAAGPLDQNAVRAALSEAGDYHLV